MYGKMINARLGSTHHMPPAIKNRLNQLNQSNYKKRDDWYILQKLGKGAFGVVYLAIHETTGQKAALKCIKIKDEESKQSDEKSNTHNSTQSTKKQTYLLYVVFVFFYILYNISSINHFYLPYVPYI